MLLPSCTSSFAICLLAVHTASAPLNDPALVCFSLLYAKAWISFSTILDSAKTHYDITTAQTNRLVEVATIVFIPGVLVFSPLSDKFGLKVVVIGSCVSFFKS